MKKYSGKQTLVMLVKLLLDFLDEINEPLEHYDNGDFVLGRKTAYVECLEIIQEKWVEGAAHGIPADIEKIYTV